MSFFVEATLWQTYLKSTAIESIDDDILLKDLMNMIKRLPEKFVVSEKCTASTPLNQSISNLEKKLQNTSSTRLQNLADKVQTVALRNHQRLMQISSVSNLCNFHQRHLSNSASASLLNSEYPQVDPQSMNEKIQNGSNLIEDDNNSLVLIFEIPGFDFITKNGAEPEEEISETFRQDAPYFDLNNPTKCRAFLDTKRKLRYALSCFTTPYNTSSIGIGTDLSTQQSTSQSNEGDQIVLTGKKCENEVDTLKQILKLLIAEAINNRDFKLTAQIREVQRCLSIFSVSSIETLLLAIKEQIETTIIMQNLQRSRLTLLHLDYHIKAMSKRINCDTQLTLECFVEILVRFILQKEDQLLRNFVHEFQFLDLQDEKIDLVDSHFRRLCELLVIEPMWHYATLENIEYARKCLERSLMTHIYAFALFPNGDADYYRDEILSKSIQQLSISINVDHPELAIPKNLFAECPWPSAQAELGIINAYKSPRDKMSCISRCCETIENLILSSTHSTVSADDILPVLVFIIIKANPPALLSNLQFIDGFYARRMQGSEAYWWVQFNSAVEFLKTLLNKLSS